MERKEEINSHTYIIHLIGIYKKHIRNIKIINNYVPADEIYALIQEQAMFKAGTKNGECKNLTFLSLSSFRWYSKIKYLTGVRDKGVYSVQQTEVKYLPMSED